MSFPRFLLLRRVCGACAMVFCCASFAAAQSILDARRVEFQPSSDHSVVDGNGIAMVDRYTMDIFLAGAATPYETVDLGKPAPEPDGYIRLDFIALLPVPLTPGVIYEATVSAVGPGGTGTSSRSNTFGLSVACSFSIAPTMQSFPRSGGSGSFTVTTAATCPWTAVSQAPWLSVTAGASGTGSGTVSFGVAPNTAPDSRNGVVLAAGWNFTVVQAGQPPPPPECSYAVSPTSQSVAWNGSTVTFTVSTAGGCAWTAASPASWAVIASGASGNGPGTVTVTVARNSGTSRSTTLTIAQQSVPLTQAGKRRPR